MKEYPKLYNRDSSGRVRVWYMQQDGGKYRTFSGLIDGQHAESDWTIAKIKNVGKNNETNPSEQAKKEIKAKYKKQLKTGYFENVEDIDNEKLFEVMLAKNLKDCEDSLDWSNVLVQIKFNGHRCVATKGGLYTRQGEKYISVPHIEKDLEEFFKKYPDAILDGELFNYSLRRKLNEISSLCRRTVNVTPQDIIDSEKMVKYYIYDGFGFGAKADDGYSLRKKYVDEVLPKYTKYVEKVEDHVVTSMAELDKLYKEFLADEQEGAIIRVTNKPYENKRSKYLLKYKPVDESEFTIVDVQSGVGNWEGAGKRIVFRMDDGTEFAGSFKGTYNDGVKFLQNKNKWIGKVVSVIYNGLTAYGIPQFARLDYNNCEKK